MRPYHRWFGHAPMHRFRLVRVIVKLYAPAVLQRPMEEQHLPVAAHFAAVVSDQYLVGGFLSVVGAQSCFFFARRPEKPPG